MTLIGEGQKMFTAQDIFEPAEEEFDLPPIAKEEGNELGRTL